MNYAESGVSIADNDRFVSLIVSLCHSTYTPEVISGIGGFCSLYQVPNSDTVIAASTDGIGSKLQLADELERHQCLTTVGFDLVGMVVNDIITCGADPVFFLDYLALNSIRSTKNKLTQIMSGVATACRLADVALIGGETAELPGLMKTTSDYDIAGFGVGFVQKKDILVPNSVQPGDAIIGIESSGPHSNGYSLIRRIFNECDWSDDSLREDIMRPTLLYPRVIKSIRCPGIHAMAHITGGGLQANTARVIPDHLVAEWDLPPISGIFKTIQECGDVSDDEMIGYSTAESVLLSSSKTTP
jgi:phosphoribosylformylglycinamidine cyclo-ligase